MSHYRTPLRVVLLVDDGLSLLDVGAVLQAFTTVNELTVDGQLLYELYVVSVGGGLIKTSSGMAIMTVPWTSLAGEAIDTLIVAGGGEHHDFRGRHRLLGIIIQVAPAVRRLCALSTGIFLLAEAGQLRGRLAAAHWRWAPLLRQRFPQMRIDADRIFIQDGKLWTAAGLAAGLDLALAMISQDYGHPTAIAAARHLVMFMKRYGNQSQFSVSLAAQSFNDPQFADLHAWIADHLCEDLRVARLAEQVCMAPRTFARTYVRQLGRTPAKTVEAMRLEAACRILESTSTLLKTVAASVGLINEHSMQRAFKRNFGISPSQYRMRHTAFHSANDPASDCVQYSSVGNSIST